MGSVDELVHQGDKRVSCERRLFETSEFRTQELDYNYIVLSRILQSLVKIFSFRYPRLFKQLFSTRPRSYFGSAVHSLNDTNKPPSVDAKLKFVRVNQKSNYPTDVQYDESRITVLLLYGPGETENDRDDD